MSLQQLKEEMSKFDIRENEKLTESFVRNYCNNHQKLRWRRGAFFDEDDKMNTMIEWLNIADSLITKAFEEGKKEAYEERNKEVLEIILSGATDVGSIYTNPNTDYVIFHGGENA